MENLYEKLGKSECYSLFGKNGMMEQLEKVKLHRGCKVIYAGYAMNTVHGVVVDENMNAVEIYEGDSPEKVENYELESSDYSLPYRWKMDGMSRPVENIYGMGTYYYTDNVAVSEETISKSLLHAEAIDKALEEKKVEDEKKRLELRANLIEKYSYLERIPEDKRDCKLSRKITGDNIRKELKRNFPNTKFSVRYSSFSGGADWSIRWEDGPTQDAVNNVVKKFQNSHSDFTGDYWDYDPSEFNNLFGGEKYVMVYREKSKDSRDKVLERYNGLDEENWKSYDGYPEDYSIGWMYDELRKPTFDDLVFSLWSHTDFSEPKDQTEKEINGSAVPEHGSIEFVDYSEKSFVVIGDTKPIKEILKGLGGKFRKGFTCGAGWVFPKTKYETVKKAIEVKQK